MDELFCVYLTDITGTIGQWLDTDFDDEVPAGVIELLREAYRAATKALDNL